MPETRTAAGCAPASPRSQSRASRRTPVDRRRRPPGRAAQVAVVHRLDAALADRVAEVVTPLAQRVELLLRDLADVAEYVRGEFLVGVVAEIFVRDVDARKVAAALAKVVDLQLGRA